MLSNFYNLTEFMDFSTRHCGPIVLTLLNFGNITHQEDSPTRLRTKVCAVFL